MVMEMLSFFLCYSKSTDLPNFTQSICAIYEGYIETHRDSQVSEYHISQVIA